MAVAGGGTLGGSATASVGGAVLGEAAVGGALVGGGGYVVRSAGGPPEQPDEPNVKLPEDIARQIANNNHSYDKHIDRGKELPGVRTREQYQAAIREAIERSVQKADFRRFDDGRIVFADRKTGLLVIFDPASPDASTAYVRKNVLDFLFSMD